MKKMFIAQFPQCCTPFLVSRDSKRLREFVNERAKADQQDVILKPLDGMGGASIYRVHPKDPNLSVILETITENKGTAAPLWHNSSFQKLLKVINAYY